MSGSGTRIKLELSFAWWYYRLEGGGSLRTTRIEAEAIGFGLEIADAIEA